MLDFVKDLWTRWFSKPEPVEPQNPYAAPSTRDRLQSFVSVHPISDEVLYEKLLEWINKERRQIILLSEQKTVDEDAESA